MSELIFVTGGSGYIAAHIVSQLLGAGYRVRTTARGAKVTQLKEVLAARFGHDKAEVVDVPNIVHGTFPLNGVDAVIHTASPLPGHDSTPKQLLDSAIEGSMNILRQTHAAGIRRFVYTGSIVAAWTPEMTLTDNDWYTPPANASLDDTSVAYSVGKTEAEKAIWAYADEHPELDVTVFNPTFLYGPLADTFPLPKDPSESRLSTATHLLRLIYPDAHFPSVVGYIDVRDTARAHVLALTTPTPTDPNHHDARRRKRFPLSSPHPLNWDNVLSLIAKNRPQLKSRLLSRPAPTYPKTKILGPTNLQRVQDVIGLNLSEYHSLESTVLDTIDSLVALEEYWLANGHALPTSTPR